MMDDRTRTDLQRYQEVLRHAREGLREKFVTRELSAILDVLNGHWFSEPSSVAYIEAEVEDAIRLNALDEKWDLSGPALLHGLRALSFAEHMALADAAERWWARVGAGEHDLASDVLFDEPEEDPHA